MLLDTVSIRKKFNLQKYLCADPKSRNDCVETNNRTGPCDRSSTVLTFFPGNCQQQKFFRMGSLTLEAAIALPVFMLVLSAILVLFSMLSIEVRLISAVNRVGRKIAAGYYAVERITTTEDEASLSEQAGVTTASYILTAVTARNMVLSELGDVLTGESVIKGGKSGMSFLGSCYDTETGDVIIRVSYEMQNPYLLLPIYLKIAKKYVFHAWVGQRNSGEAEEDIVYVTEHGEVYHRVLTCTHLNLNIEEIPFSALESRRNEKGGKYYPCDYCGDRAGETVFITVYGERYHYNRNCSGLKRGVRSVPLSQVTLPACADCAGGY